MDKFNFCYIKTEIFLLLFDFVRFIMSSFWLNMKSKMNSTCTPSIVYESNSKNISGRRPSQEPGSARQYFFLENKHSKFLGMDVFKNFIEIY